MKGRIARPEAQKSRLILPRVGKVKIGMKGAGGYPQSVDYFIPTGTAYMNRGICENNNIRNPANPSFAPLLFPYG